MLVGVLILACVCVLAASVVWQAVRAWKDPSVARGFAQSMSARASQGLAWALTRGLVVLAAQFVCGAVMVLCAGLASHGVAATDGLAHTSHPAEPWKVLALIAFCAFVCCSMLLASIGVFNRPSRLVLPYLRDRRRL